MSCAGEVMHGVNSRTGKYIYIYMHGWSHARDEFTYGWCHARAKSCTGDVMHGWCHARGEVMHGWSHARGEVSPAGQYLTVRKYLKKYLTLTKYLKKYLTLTKYLTEISHGINISACLRNISACLIFENISRYQYLTLSQKYLSLPHVWKYLTVPISQLV